MFPKMFPVYENSVSKGNFDTAKIVPGVICLLALKLCSPLLCIVSEWAHPTPAAKTSAQLLQSLFAPNSAPNVCRVNAYKASRPSAGNWEHPVSTVAFAIDRLYWAHPKLKKKQPTNQPNNLDQPYRNVSQTRSSP